MNTEPEISSDEILILNFAVAHNLDIHTVRRLIAQSDITMPVADILAELDSDLKRGLVLYSVKAKGISRAKLRQLTRENGTRKPRELAPSRKRTAKERKQVVSKLREHRRKRAG